MFAIAAETYAQRTNRPIEHPPHQALGHLAALRKLRSLDEKSSDYAEGGCCVPVNLGTGTGVSVLDLVKGMEEATGAPAQGRHAPRWARGSDEQDEAP